MQVNVLLHRAVKDFRRADNRHLAAEEVRRAQDRVKTRGSIERKVERKTERKVERTVERKVEVLYWKTSSSLAMPSPLVSA